MASIMAEYHPQWKASNVTTYWSFFSGVCTVSEKCGKNVRKGEERREEGGGRREEGGGRREEGGG
jgi:hypothetical protein